MNYYWSCLKVNWSLSHIFGLYKWVFNHVFKTNHIVFLWCGKSSFIFYYVISKALGPHLPPGPPPSCQSLESPREDGRIELAVEDKSPRICEGPPPWPNGKVCKGSSWSKCPWCGKPKSANLGDWCRREEDVGGGRDGKEDGVTAGVDGTGEAWPGRGKEDPWPRECERQWSKYELCIRYSLSIGLIWGYTPVGTPTRLPASPTLPPVPPGPGTSWGVFDGWGCWLDGLVKNKIYVRI